MNKHPASLKFRKPNIRSKLWTDWQWQLANTVQNAHQLCRYIKLTEKQIEQIQEIITARYLNGHDAMRLTPYLVSLIDFNDSNDPIALQHIPQKAESNPDNLNYEKIWELDKDFLDGKNRMIQQKYPDIVLLRISNTCMSFCRFCFEKERTLRSKIRTFVTEKNFQHALEIISSKKNIRQVLLSGGDPLVFTDGFLKAKIGALCEIPHLKTIRLNTRTFLHNPFRITLNFARMLGKLQKNSWQNGQKGKQIEIGTHFNHPKELTSEAVTAIRQLQKEGIQLYNQTVLLRGINNNSRIMGKLFCNLREEGVRLHYLGITMPVPRTLHFKSTIKEGQKIMRELVEKREFRGQLPHLEFAHFSGKQILGF